jgi:hypothetical protein
MPMTARDDDQQMVIDEVVTLGTLRELRDNGTPGDVPAIALNHQCCDTISAATVQGAGYPPSASGGSRPPS